MDSTLTALGGILLKAIPTLILLLILHVYLKAMFFKPLEEVLEKRRQATEGARELAEASLKRAAERAAEYDAKLNEARAQIYREHEDLRRRWVQDQAGKLEETRQNTQQLVRQAKAQMDQDVAAAKRDLGATAGTLADQITDSLLNRRAS